MRKNKNEHILLIFCVLKHVFDNCFLRYIVEERKHYPFGLMYIISFLRNNNFSLITTMQNIHISNEISLLKKNICFIHLNRKTAAQTKSFNL